MKNFVAKPFKSSLYDPESAPFVVYIQSFDVFAENYLRFMNIAYTRNIEKESSSACAFIVIVKAHTLSCKAKCLAGKACKANIEFRNITFVYLCYIAGNVKTVMKICFVSFLSVGIPLTHEYCLYVISECLIKSETNTSDSGK